MFLSFFVLLLNIPSNVNLALWRLCASSRMANLRSVFHSFMAYATLRSVALLFGNHTVLPVLSRYYFSDYAFCNLKVTNHFFILPLIILPGLPTTVLPSGTSQNTTAPAPIVTLLPIFTPPNTVAPVYIFTLSPMVGRPPFPLPRGTICRQ